MASAQPSPPTQTYSVILFYKYAPLSDDETKMTLLRDALEELCSSLNLTGRILLGMSTDAEGINGTLAGRKEDVVACTLALLGKGAGGTDSSPSGGIANEAHQCILETFWQKSEEFARMASVPPLYLETPEDFKWSTVQSSGPLFPDLNIKLVKEIISTGGKLKIKIEDTRKGYLTPEEWHEEMKKLGKRAKDDDANDNTILIDCRNHKEYEIGHFEGALDPNTKTFDQFPRWVHQNKAGLEGKNVLMCK
jgi:predicted sulfurtransferase